MEVYGNNNGEEDETYVDYIGCILGHSIGSVSTLSVLYYPSLSYNCCCLNQPTAMFGGLDQSTIHTQIRCTASPQTGSHFNVTRIQLRGQVRNEGSTHHIVHLILVVNDSIAADAATVGLPEDREFFSYNTAYTYPAAAGYRGGIFQTKSSQSYSRILWHQTYDMSNGDPIATSEHSVVLLQGIKNITQPAVWHEVPANNFWSDQGGGTPYIGQPELSTRTIEGTSTGFTRAYTAKFVPFEVDFPVNIQCEVRGTPPGGASQEVWSYNHFRKGALLLYCLTDEENAASKVTFSSRITFTN